MTDPNQPELLDELSASTPETSSDGGPGGEAKPKKKATRKRAAATKKSTRASSKKAVTKKRTSAADNADTDEGQAAESTESEGGGPSREPASSETPKAKAPRKPREKTPEKDEDSEAIDLNPNASGVFSFDPDDEPPAPADNRSEREVRSDRDDRDDGADGADQDASDGHRPKANSGSDGSDREDRRSTRGDSRGGGDESRGNRYADQDDTASGNDDPLKRHDSHHRQNPKFQKNKNRNKNFQKGQQQGNRNPNQHPNQNRNNPNNNNPNKRQKKKGNQKNNRQRGNYQFYGAEGRDKVEVGNWPFDESLASLGAIRRLLKLHFEETAKDADKADKAESKPYAISSADGDDQTPATGSTQRGGDTDTDTESPEPTLAEEQAEAIKEGPSKGMTFSEEPLDLNTVFGKNLQELIYEGDRWNVELDGTPNRSDLIEGILETATEKRHPVHITGIIETTEDGYGLVTFRHEDYRIKPFNGFVAEALMDFYGLKRGHYVKALALYPGSDGDDNVLVVADILETMDEAPLEATAVDPFEELVPYYPLERILLETEPTVSWDNISMRVIDLLTPIGLGQRGLIVAPPRTGKTVILQGIANSIVRNKPDAHLIVLLIDERPEEVTDFRRQVQKGEVISSTFDENAESHVHCAEMVIEKSRRLVEKGKDVIILLDSITRLARAYNTMMPSSGKILSGGVEASALQKPKRFFGSARNIEEGGSLTILATALVETGSRMDEVIFEEFKGTGNMELHLDRALVDKRIFPAINLEKSGTRKEELLYHPQEMEKIYSLRRAMKGVPSTEAMEMLIQRIKRTKTNAEFLMTLNR